MDINLYNYFTEKFQGNFTLPRSILLTKHPERSKGIFCLQIGRGKPWLSKIFDFPKN
jgi:hypothetical protein